MHSICCPRWIRPGNEMFSFGPSTRPKSQISITTRLCNTRLLHQYATHSFSLRVLMKTKRTTEFYTLVNETQPVVRLITDEKANSLLQAFILVWKEKGQMESHTACVDPKTNKFFIPQQGFIRSKCCIFPPSPSITLSTAHLQPFTSLRDLLLEL